MLKRFKYKSNHAMYGKTHNDRVRKLNSKQPGELNPMFFFYHSEVTLKL